MTTIPVATPSYSPFHLEPDGAEPETIWEVLHRHKDVQYSSRIANHIARQREAHVCVTSSQNLLNYVPDH